MGQIATYAMPKHDELSMPPASKKDKRQRLLAASLHLFRIQGYDQTKVSQITRAAGVAKGTFFNYFPSKEQVLLALGEEVLGRVGNIPAQEMTTAKTARAKIKAIFHGLAAGLESDRELVREMVYRGLRLPDLIGGERAKLDFRGMLVLLIEQGKRDGEVAAQADARFIADSLYMLYFQQVVSWCSGDFQLDLAARLDEVVDLVFDGVQG